MTPFSFFSAVVPASFALWIALPVAQTRAAEAQTVHDVSYLEAGRSEKLDLYLPARDPADPPSPAVVWIHGGGWTGGSKKEARAQEVCGTLAGAGYVCASIDYRLGADSWPGDLFDCKNAVRFLRVHAADYHIDPDRIAVMGGSAGGHLALMVGLTAGEPALEPQAPYPGIPDMVGAVVDLYGPADLLTLRGADAKGNALAKPAVNADPTAALGKDSQAGLDLWRAASPVNHVSPDSPPVLIAHGTVDSLVNFGQSAELERILTQNGVAHEFVALEHVGHSFDLTSWDGKPMSRDLRPVVLGFLRQYFGTPAHGLPVSPLPPSPRIQIDLDGEWKFYPADNVHGSEAGFDDAAWKTVSVPHTWNALDGEDGGNNYRRGAAWYRRHLRLDSSLAGKRLYLQFDGVSLMADAYVNGVHVGTHKGGFARFRFDVTDALKTGQDNLISVRVDNGMLGIPPVSADFTFFGGIYRSVSLLATNQVQISATDYGSPGVYLDQNEITSERADLTVRSQVESYADKGEEVEVHAHLLDAAGHEVASAGNKGNLAGGDAVEESQHLSVPHPHLWNGEADPYLYTLRVDILAKGELSDSVTQTVGLRSFRVDPDKGFFLNGRSLDLHGVNRHQDRIDKGWAISMADEAEDFDLVRELGCSAIRVSHYQQSDTWYQRCDRTGIVAWAEVPFVGPALPSPEFLDNAKQQLRELIRQNYNHPSICFWSVGNETQGSSADKVIAELANVARAQDQTRLSTYASNAKENDPRNWRTDVVAFNHYAGWYSEEFTALPAWLDNLHKLHPQSAIGVSEFGAGASIFEHEEPPRHPVTKSHFHPEEYQALLHENSWLALRDRPYVWGKFIWCMFDFASDGRSEGDHDGRNDKGLVTYDRRFRKDAFYWYKANWSDEPFVWIASRRFLERHKPQTEVKVYSTAPDIELTVNGASLGLQHSADHLFRWPGVRLVPGENHVAATAHFGDLIFTDACTWRYSAPSEKSSPPARDNPAEKGNPSQKGNPPEKKS
jgi:beta-galactosidase